MKEVARWKRDVILGICFEVFFLIAYIYSLNIPAGTMANIKAAQPGVYVRLWLIVFALLSLVMIINAIHKKDTTVVPPIFHLQSVITLIAVGAYIGLMDILGFTLSTFLFTTALILDYSWAASKFMDKNGKRKRGVALAKSILIYLLISVIVVAATQYIFESLLMVNLP